MAGTKRNSKQKKVGETKPNSENSKSEAKRPRLTTEFVAIDEIEELIDK